MADTLLFTTDDHSDAILAGYGEATVELGDGGFSVTLDESPGGFVTLVLNGPDGEVSVSGWAAIRWLRIAVEQAERIASKAQTARAA